MKVLVLELSAEIVPNARTRFGETISPNYFLDFYATACHETCLKTPQILASNLYSLSIYHFVRLFYQLVYTRKNCPLLRYSSIII